MNLKLLIWLVIAATILAGAYLLFQAPGSGVTPQPVPPTAGTNAPPTSSGKVEVAIRGFAFASATTRVSPGVTIIWKNYDDAAHSVVGANFKSGTLQKGQSYSRTFTQPGDYFYSCGIHPNMKGEIVVR